MQYVLDETILLIEFIKSKKKKMKIKCQFMDHDENRMWFYFEWGNIADFFTWGMDFPGRFILPTDIPILQLTGKLEMRRNPNIGPYGKWEKAKVNNGANRKFKNDE